MGLFLAELKRNPTNKNDFARKRARFNALIDRHTDTVSTFKKAVMNLLVKMA